LAFGVEGDWEAGGGVFLELLLPVVSE